LWKKRATSIFKKIQGQARVVNIIGVFFVFFLISGDLWAAGTVNIPFSSVADSANSGSWHDISDGNGTVAGKILGNSTVSESVAEEQTSSAVPEKIIYQFDTVRVSAEKNQVGKATITGTELHSLPSHTGTITDALKVLPNVQFSNQESSSLTLGDVAPPRVSISGAKPYENNFLIDGMSISNTLNPSGLDVDGDSPSGSSLEVNGADQTIFYDVSLVDSVTVYTSNVPAKYGNFLGGVVDAELVVPRLDRWHAVLSGRHTRSEWYDLRGVDYESDDASNQPRFRTDKLLAVVDGPLSEKAGLLLSASRTRSVIPLKFEELDGSLSDKDQYRSNENFFAKVMALPRHDLKITLDGTFAPYSEERWRKAWDDSEWRLENKAWRFGGSAESDTSWGLLVGKVVYSQNGYSRDAEQNVVQQVQGDGVPESELVKRGSLGDSQVENRAIDLGVDVDMDKFETGALVWRFSTGLSMNHVETDMWFEEARLENKTVFSSGKWTQISAEYPRSEQFGMLTSLGWYAQSEIEWGRFSLTPGLRIDYDDFSYNTNFAPRLKAEFDTLGDGFLRIVVGANRYYGGQLRAYAFKKWRPSTSTLQMSSGFEKTTTSDDKLYTAKGLDTPYSDEFMGGVVGDVSGFSYGLELVHRDHRDQLISKSFEDGLYEMTNDGQSTYDGIVLSLSRSFETKRFGKHSFTLGATQSWTETFNGAYSSEIDLLKDSYGYLLDYDKVFYNGKIIDRSDLPAEDYNAPLVLTLSWLGSFFDDRLQINCVSRWRDSTTGLKNDARTEDETPYGTVGPSATSKTAKWLDEDQVYYHDAYREGVISGGLVTDVSFELDAVKEETFTLSLLLDVFNVFASDGHTGVSEVGGGGILPRSQYGRGYYAGVRCEF
jgi:hypothetical protein